MIASGGSRALPSDSAAARFASPPPAAFFRAEQQRLIEATRSGPLIDLACGRGRNAIAAAELGMRTLALDRNPSFLRELGAIATERGLCVERLRADLETPHGISLRPGSCAVALVFRFLYRPLCRHIEALLQPGGWLLYETFTKAQAELPNGPNNPAFLLSSGELPELFPGLEVHLFEEHSSSGERPEATAKLLARKPG